MRVEVDQINDIALLVQQMILLGTSAKDLLIWRGAEGECSGEVRAWSIPFVVPRSERLERREFIRQQCFRAIVCDSVERELRPRVVVPIGAICLCQCVAITDDGDFRSIDLLVVLHAERNSIFGTFQWRIVQEADLLAIGRIKGPCPHAETIVAKRLDQDRFESMPNQKSCGVGCKVVRTTALCIHQGGAEQGAKPPRGGEGHIEEEKKMAKCWKTFARGCRWLFLLLYFIYLGKHHDKSTQPSLLLEGTQWHSGYST